MSRREIQELEKGRHPELLEAKKLMAPDATDEEVRLYLQGREAAAARLADCRTACDLAADASYELQAHVARELVCAEAVAKEWGVLR